MKLLYPQEHFSCYNYSGTDSPSIQIMEGQAGRQTELYVNVNTIIFVRRGTVNLSFGKNIDTKIGKGQVVLIPTNNHVVFEFSEDTVLMLFRLRVNLNFCDHFSLELLLEGTDKSKDSGHLSVLKSNERIDAFLELLHQSMKDGLKCSYFFDIKMKEILFYLRAYYSKEELYDFFYPVLSTDISFSEAVLQNYQKHKTVKDLANALNYSMSGFEKRFKKVFGLSASQWMKKQKAEAVYHTINCSRKTFSEIAYDYGFSSASHFNDFCKSEFGDTPGKIRKLGLQEIDRVKKAKIKKIG